MRDFSPAATEPPGWSGASRVGRGFPGFSHGARRSQATLADGSHWLYAYDALGQVTSGKKYWSDQTPVAGEQFTYQFDNIGNRTSTGAGGDQNGQNLRQATYTANNLNQYTQRTVPGDVDIMGLAFATNSVTVNTQTAYRKGEYFRDQYAVNNTSSALWTNVTVAEGSFTNTSGNVFVPKTPEAFSYDADGNLLSDGRWAYAWDAENRLISMTTNTSAGPPLVLTFGYDWKGRRIQKEVIYGATLTTNTTFAYDGWNPIARMNETNSSVVQSYLWGLDLSGSSQGAGGVGGLLEVSDTANGVHFAAYDGNGNVVALVQATAGTSSATYEYGPFGELLRATGPMAKANPFRFSSKFDDDETDLLYYGYRYYNASTARWLNRDPYREPGFETGRGRPTPHLGTLASVTLASERGQPNLFASLRNAPLNDFDFLGLCDQAATASPPALPNNCGKDVTQLVHLTLRDIADTYAAASWYQRVAAAATMFTPAATWSWDIRYLYDYHGVNNTTFPLCKPTVMFEGTCVGAQELNYIMFGWGIVLCGENRWFYLNALEQLLLQRWQWGNVGDDTEFSIDRKVAFAAYGANQYPNLPVAKVAWPFPCSKTNEKENLRDITYWKWKGLKWP